MTSRLCTTLALLAAFWSLDPLAIRAAAPADGSDYGRPSDISIAAPRDYRSASRPTSSPSSSPRFRRSTLASTRSSSNIGAEEIDSPPAWTDYRTQTGPYPDSMMEGQGQFSDVEYGDDNGGPCYPNCPPGRGPIYARGEYLLWWVKGDTVPALVTTSAPTVTRAQAGVLGQPETTVLFGDQPLNNTGRSGGRVVLGWWLNPNVRIEGDFFILGQANTGFSAASPDTAILARPFFNLRTGLQDSNVIAFPNQLQGSVIAAESSAFLGAGLHATHNLAVADFGDDRNCRVDFLYGYRYLQLQDRLTISGTSTSIDPNGVTPVGTSFLSSDSFSTFNNFNGADLGLVAESRCQRWCLTTIGRLGIGGTYERVTIGGSTTAVLPNGTSTTTPGGLLALPTNIGTYRNTGFAVVPELELKLGFDLTQNLRFTVGYDLIYWSRVVRPGGQIDTFVNTSQSSGRPLVGTPGPLFAFHESDLWVQGLSVGGELRF